MKTILTCLCLLLIAVSSHAGTLAENIATCDTPTKLANSIMIARQIGVPMQEIMAAFPGDPTTLYIAIVTEAYAVPAFQGQEYRDRAIAEFTDKTYLECVNIMKGGQR